MSRIVLIAAMEREVGLLVRGWQRGTLASARRSFVVFEKDELVVVVSGIGKKNAEQAAHAAAGQFRPAQLVSAGLAGALIRSLKVGSVVTPNVVVEAESGAEYRTATAAGSIGGGILITADSVAGIPAKQKLVEHLHGLVVDMEAAGVAKVAQAEHIAFRCVKAISDEAEFAMPPLAQFMDADGNFHTARFALWAALRPWRWATVVALGSNSRRATKALCQWLEKDLARGPRADVVTLNRAELSEARMK